MRRALLILALGFSACPAQVPLECKTCSTDDECAVQGLTCVAGRCGTCLHGAVGTLPAPGFVRDASTVFEDDFESGGILPDAGGKWDEVQKADAPGQTLRVGRDAGRGGAALVLTDSSATNGNPEYGVFAAEELPDLTGDLYVRVQLWLSAVDFLGPHPVAIYSAQVYQSVAAEVITRGAVAFQSGEVGGADDCTLPGSWGLGAWHQVDLVLSKMGSAGGFASWRVDGVSCGFARNWEGAKVGSIALGATAMDNRWVGQLRHDNVAVTVGGPAPGRLAWVRPDVLAANRCAPVRLQLEDTFDGGLARAVRPVRVAVDAGTAGLYASGCDGPAVATVLVPKGAAFVELFFEAPAGQAGLSAVDLGADLDPARASWMVP